MSQSRQLAAIMFTDIVGYTALMGSDEEKAFALLNQNRSLQKPIIEKHNGKWIKELGDGVLASFSTVTDAVLCATIIQKQCSEIHDLKLRIGIHLGEVVFENDDVFGDGVNIASRLQALAPPCGIWISESVYKNISNKKDINTKLIGEKILKNVKDPVQVYEILTNQIHQPPGFIDKIVARKISEKSIAVLPFVNMSNDPEQEYFSDGMAEEILNSLAHLQDLKVAGRTSSFQFKGKNIDLREVGEKLCVSTVLEGSVRKQINRLRVTAQLISVHDGFHLWSEKYDRDMDDIFAIQDEIAFAITENLKIIFLEKEKVLINTNPTENKEAYELYLKGRYFYNKRGIYLKKSLEYFQQAVNIDPAFALAYTGIADAFALLSFFAIIPPNIGMPKAKSAVEKAIQLDPLRVETYATLGFINAFHSWDLKEAKKDFQKAFNLNPNYSQAYNWYCLYLFFAENNMTEALVAVTKNVDLDPLSSTPHNLKAGVVSVLGRQEEAMNEIQISLELDPNYFFTYLWQGCIFIKFKNYGDALMPLNKAAELSGRHQWTLAILCWLYSNTGNIPEAQKIHDELLSRKNAEYISGWFLFTTAYSLKKYDEAFEFLEIAFEEKMPLLLSCRSDLWPMAEDLKIDARFQDAIGRLNFPE